jgi:uncharacterized protein YndB with AHSA1/START domain
MTAEGKPMVTVEISLNAPVEKIWKAWTDPRQIVKWYHASDDWHTPEATNDLRTGGKFLFRMQAKTGNEGFDFKGEYSRVDIFRQIDYIIDDGRRVQVLFSQNGNKTIVSETFEAEKIHPVEMQRAGWQSILDNFKKHIELYDDLETLHFEIFINASAQKVYDIMLDEGKFSEWTAEFNPSSHFIGSWEKGAKIIFLGADKDGSTGGMVSRIKENIPGRFISIEHLGVIQNGKEILEGPEIDGWAGALENYSFEEVNGKTMVSVDMDANQEFKAYFIETWPKALKKLKDICEK